MNEVALEHLGEGRFALSGPLDYTSVVPALELGKQVFQGHARVELDLAGVTRANSAGLALLLEWVGDMQHRDAQFTLLHLPAALADIARISNVSELLPLGQP